MQQILHYFLHFGIPLMVSLAFFRNRWYVLWMARLVALSANGVFIYQHACKLGDTVTSLIFNYSDNDKPCGCPERTRGEGFSKRACCTTHTHLQKNSIVNNHETESVLTPAFEQLALMQFNQDQQKLPTVFTGYSLYKSPSILHNASETRAILQCYQC